MKILFLADSNSIHTQRWAKGLCDKGLEIHIFTLNTPDKSLYKDSPQIQIFSVNHGSKTFEKNDGALSKLKYLKALPTLKKIIKELKPDYVHAHYASSYGLLGALSRFKPFFLSLWGSDVFIFPKNSIIHRLVFKYVMGKATEVFSSSNVMKEEAVQYLNREIHVIPFGIDTDRFKKTTEPFQSETITLGLAKKLEPIYGIDILINAFKLLKDSLPDQKLKLKIAGDGYERQNLEELAKSLNVDKDVEFLGRVEHDKVPEFYNSIDIAVFPSRSESFGVSALEASACGRPVVAAKVGGLVEVVKDGDTGTLFQNHSSSNLSTSLYTLIVNNAQARQMGQKGLKVVNLEFKWDQCLNRLLKFYH